MASDGFRTGRQFYDVATAFSCVFCSTIFLHGWYVGFAHLRKQHATSNLTMPGSCGRWLHRALLELAYIRWNGGGMNRKWMRWREKPILELPYARWNVILMFKGSHELSENVISIFQVSQICRRAEKPSGAKLHHNYWSPKDHRTPYCIIIIYHMWLRWRPSSIFVGAWDGLIFTSELPRGAWDGLTPGPEPPNGAWDGLMLGMEFNQLLNFECR